MRIVTIPAKRVSAPSDTLVNVIGEEAVLLNLKSEHYFGLDEVGTRMWTALTTSDSVEAACEILLAEYDVDAERLRQDLDDLVEKLVGHGLVEVSDE